MEKSTSHKITHLASLYIFTFHTRRKFAEKIAALHAFLKAFIGLRHKAGEAAISLLPLHLRFILLSLRIQDTDFKMFCSIPCKYWQMIFISACVKTGNFLFLSLVVYIHCTSVLCTYHPSFIVTDKKQQNRYAIKIYV